MSDHNKLISVEALKMIYEYLAGTRMPIRNEAIFLLSLEGLRVAQIAALEWEDIEIDGSGRMAATISRNKRIKHLVRFGQPLTKCLLELRKTIKNASGPVIRSERGDAGMSAQAIANWFQRLYSSVGLEHLSSSSGRRTFIAHALLEEALIKIEKFAGHGSAETTMQHYLQAKNSLWRLPDQEQQPDNKEE